VVKWEATLNIWWPVFDECKKYVALAKHDDEQIASRAGCSACHAGVLLRNMPHWQLMLLCENMLVVSWEHFTSFVCCALL
jgi:hypothetical protein